MANRFWVGGTGTWDASDTTHWAATSGGAGGQSVPTSADTVTFDGASGGGTVTVNFGGTISIQSLSFGAFTGTLDFATNNNNITLSAGTPVFGSGTGTRTLNMGSGTWSLTGGNASWFFQNTTNLTLNAGTSTIAFTGTATGVRAFEGGGKTYNIVTVNSSANHAFRISGANTIGALTVAAPNRILFPVGKTNTITNFTNIIGSSSSNVGIISSDPNFGIATVSSANNWAGDWCGLMYMTFSGGGTFAATNSLNLGNNTGITITPPSGGGGVVGVIGG